MQKFRNSVVNDCLVWPFDTRGPTKAPNNTGRKQIQFRDNIWMEACRFISFTSETTGSISNLYLFRFRFVVQTALCKDLSILPPCPCVHVRWLTDTFYYLSTLFHIYHYFSLCCVRIPFLWPVMISPETVSKLAIWLKKSGRVTEILQVEARF